MLTSCTGSNRLYKTSEGLNTIFAFHLVHSASKSRTGGTQISVESVRCPVSSAPLIEAFDLRHLHKNHFDWLRLVDRSSHLVSKRRSHVRSEVHGSAGRSLRYKEEIEI